MTSSEESRSVGHRLPSRRRLKGAETFERVFRSGKRRSGKFFVIHGAPSDRPAGGLGLVVGKRIAGNNVLRNRVKRLIREAFRHSSLSAGRTDVIVRLKAIPDDRHWAQARDELARLLGEFA